jgi:hypothetical protein
MGKTNWDFSIIKTGHVLLRICDGLEKIKHQCHTDPTYSLYQSPQATDQEVY